MTEIIEVAAGLDLHKKFIQATILTLSGGKKQERFERTRNDLIRLKDWILNNGVQALGCESTSDYWVLIYDMLNQDIPVIVGNAQDIKSLSHKKTDKVDSEYIALLTLKGMIQPSRVMPKSQREFRSLTRLRHRLIQKRTDIKNEMHHILDSELFRLSSALKDIFGKTGLVVLNGVTKGLPVDDIVKCIPPTVKYKERVLREVMEQTLSQDALLRLSVCLTVMYCLNEQINLITQSSIDYAYSHYSREMKILTSVPGIGDVSAMTLLAEIGNIKDFSSGDKLASWLGIVPRVYQSADKLHTGSITKRGSEHARWILTQIAHVASRSRNNTLKSFYSRKKAVIGAGKSVIALARKIVVIIWHLLMNNELYDDGLFTKKSQPKRVSIKIPAITSLEEILQLLKEASVIINSLDPDPV
jgi:transposase/CRISPR-associated protein Csx1